MKEMIYKGEIEFSLIESGDLDGFEWAIVSHGSHPCAYIAPPEDHPATKMYRNFRWTSLNVMVAVHGGITYAKFGLPEVDPKGKKFWIGWDYAHYGDYVDFGTIPAMEGKKYSTEEIFSDVQAAIEQLKKVKELDKWNG